MIPTLFGVLLHHLRRHPVRAGGPVEQMVAQLQGREPAAKAAGAGARLPRPPGRRREARRGDQEALRLRQAAARALRADARASSRASTWARASSTQGRVAADPGEAAGLDQPGPVDLLPHLPDRGAARRRQGGAGGHALRHRHHAASCCSAMRSPASCWAWCCWWSSAAAARQWFPLRGLTSLNWDEPELGRARSSTTSGTSRCR